MRGSPLIRALVALAILLALGLPLRRMLPAATVAQQAIKKPEEKKIHLQIDFTTAPKSFRVLSLGEEVWAASNPGASAEHNLQLAFPKEGIDLQFEMAWPEETFASARVRLIDPSGNEHVAGIWGKGMTTEVLTFQ